MPTSVRDHMNPKVLYLREGDHLELVLRPMLQFGVTAVPLLDGEHRPVGLVSLRDLFPGEHHSPRPAFLLLDSTSVHKAARALGKASVHHAVVVDAAGRAVGMISALDLLRALVGLPADHPATFANEHPHIHG
jgi:CBS domain-containing protein